MRKISFGLTLTLALAASAAFAAPPATGVPANIPDKPTLVTPQGAYQTAWLTLEGATPPGRIFVALRDGRPVQFWSLSQQLPGSPAPSGFPQLLVDAMRGQTAGGATTAEFDLRLVSIWAPITNVASIALTLDLKTAGQQVSGEWSTKLAGKDAARGTLTGTLRSAEESADALAPGQNWSSFHGALSAARGPDYGKPMIDDLAQAKPLWRAEAATLSGWGTGADGRYKERAAYGTLCGGSSSPVVADGVVYLYSYVPSGDVEPAGADAELVAKHAANPAEKDAMRRWFSTRADVVVTAIDGATGRTLWQSTWPLKQGNFQTHKWRGRNPTPAVANGTLVVADYSYGLHAYDAKTGQLKWSRGGGGAITGNSAPLGPVIVGNVVVYAASKETLGLDLSTGKELFKAPGALSARRMSIADHERVLLVGPTLALLDPAAGKVLWTSDAGTKDKLDVDKAMPVCFGDKLLATAAVGKDKAVTVAYNVSDTGLAKLWQNDPPGPIDENLVLAAAPGVVFAAHQDALRAIDLATGKTLKTIEELKAGSNATLITVDNRAFYQPECQHGRQHINVLEAVAPDFRILTKDWAPRHNNTTAYGMMALTNVVVDGRLITRGIDGLYCYDVRSSR